MIVLTVLAAAKFCGSLHHNQHVLKRSPRLCENKLVKLISRIVRQDNKLIFFCFCSWSKLFQFLLILYFTKNVASREYFFLILKIKNTKEVVLEFQTEEDTRGPCTNNRIGDDDLGGYDFIRQFQLDSIETHYRGVTEVRGSNRIQTAYRLDKIANLTLPTR